MMPKSTVKKYLDFILIKTFSRTFLFSRFVVVVVLVVMKKVMRIGMFECFSNETSISFYIDMFIKKMKLCDFE